MYTQCPDCTTVFRVTADALRTARGNVRCGVCSTSFNALEKLSEEPFRAGPEAEYAPAPQVTITAEEVPAMESPHMAAAAPTGELPPSPTIDPGAIAASLTISHHELARAEEYPGPFETSRISIPDEMRRGLAEEAAASAIDAPDFAEPGAEESPHRWRWAMGTAILMLMLVAQVVHGQRDQLIHRPGIGQLLAQIYSLVGLPLSEPTDLASYELRQWGAASDATQAGRLLLRASIVNRADYAQPYPLLRLALQDRFGTTVAVRDIQPVDYLPGSGAGNLLEPGQRADAEIRIVDPGKDAVGFEMDVCLSMPDGVRCANQTPPATP